MWTVSAPSVDRTSESGQVLSTELVSLVAKLGLSSRIVDSMALDVFDSLQ